MMTRLTTKEFEFRLKELTRSGEPSIMGTPLSLLTFNFSQEPFYGQIENSKFRLTNNSSISPTGAIIEGNYSKADKGTNIDYQIKTMSFPYFMVRAFPILGVIIFNAIIALNSLPFGVNVALTLFLGLAFLYWRWTEKRKLKKLEKMFIKELEIEH